MKSNAPCAVPRWLEAYPHENVRGSFSIQPPGSPTTFSSGTNTLSNATLHDTVERMPSMCQSSSSLTPGASVGTTANTIRDAYAVSPSTAHHTIKYFAVAATDANAFRAVKR